MGVAHASKGTACRAPTNKTKTLHQRRNISQHIVHCNRWYINQVGARRRRAPTVQGRCPVPLLINWLIGCKNLA